MSGSLEYRVLPEWSQVGDALGFTEIPDCGFDVDGTLYLLGRTEAGGAVVGLDSGGSVVRRWSDSSFRRPHGLSVEPGGGTLWVVDDFSHSVRRFTTSGELLLTIAAQATPDFTGYVRGDTDSVRRAGPPFCYPTAASVAANGDLLVSDGYGNSRVHRFAADGRLLASWGEPGREPGQLRLPHGVLAEPDRILVADRENNRVQVFDHDGRPLAAWTDCRRPAAVRQVQPGLYVVAELGWVNQAHGTERVIDPTAPSGRVTLRDHDGGLLSEFTPAGTGVADPWFAPHGLEVGPGGEIVVTETFVTFFRGQAPARPALRWFEPVG